DVAAVTRYRLEQQREIFQGMKGSLLCKANRRPKRKRRFIYVFRVETEIRGKLSIFLQAINVFGGVAVGSAVEKAGEPPEVAVDFLVLDELVDLVDGGRARFPKGFGGVPAEILY